MSNPNEELVSLIMANLTQTNYPIIVVSLNNSQTASKYHRNMSDSQKNQISTKASMSKSWTKAPRAVAQVSINQTLKRVDRNKFPETKFVSKQ